MKYENDLNAESECIDRLHHNMFEIADLAGLVKESMITALINHIYEVKFSNVSGYVMCILTCK